MTINTQKIVNVLSGFTGPTGTFKVVNIIPNFTGPTGLYPQWAAYTGPTGASMAKGVYKNVINIGPTGPSSVSPGKGIKTVVIPGFSSGGGGGSTSTWNPLDKSAAIVLDAPKTTLSLPTTGTNAGVRGTLSRATGKWYLEFSNYVDGQFNNRIGFAQSLHDLSQYNSNNCFGVQCPGGFLDGGSPQMGEVQGHNMGVAIDIDAGRYWCRLDGGTWFGSGTADPSNTPSGANYTGSVALATAIFPYAQLFSNTGNLCTLTLNTGGSAFAFAAPAGYLPWG